jgi:hypothetical protein
VRGWLLTIRCGATPPSTRAAAAEKAFKRVEEIFSKYPIEQFPPPAWRGR